MKDFSAQYLTLLKTKYSGLNLTKILKEDEFYNKQILDSINPFSQSDLFREQVYKKKIVVDVGFGGGFPILPLAKSLPEIDFIGIETRKKKVDAVKDIAKDLNLKNVTLIHSRVENIIFDQSCVITFKAVGRVDKFLPLIQSCYQKELHVFFYKGPSFLELEQESFKDVSHEWKYLKTDLIDVPGTEQRMLASFRNLTTNSKEFLKNPGKIVPRGTSKNLVKLSELI